MRPISGIDPWLIVASTTKTSGLTTLRFGAT